MDVEELFVKKQSKWKRRYIGKHNFKGKIEKYLFSSGRHLDFGCGFGNFCYFLAKDYPEMEVFGVDIDKDKIRYSNSQYNLKNLHLSSNIKIKGEFDTISLFFLVHELEDTISYLTDFYNHIKKGGYIFVYDFRKVSRDEFIEWHEKKKVIGEYIGSFEEQYNIHNKWKLKEFEEIMKSIGFKKIISKEAGAYWFWYIGKKL